jgi:hypothetical protein
MPKFTKGPWQVLPEEADKDYIRIRGTVLGGRYKIANVPTPTYEGVHPRELAESRANAALIAAAPELLAALEDVLVVGRGSSGRIILEADDEAAIRAAIAKVKGE